mgnify:CR=1 FL=1
MDDPLKFPHNSMRKSGGRGWLARWEVIVWKSTIMSKMPAINEYMCMWEWHNPQHQISKSCWNWAYFIYQQSFHCFKEVTHSHCQFSLYSKISIPLTIKNQLGLVDHVCIETDIFIIPSAKIYCPLFPGIVVHESMVTALNFDLVLMYGRV